MKKWIAVAVIFMVILCVVGWAVGVYNSLINSREQVKKQWGQVENVYQRRSDLIPNLIETVQGYAFHERTTFTAVTEARAKATQMTIDPSKIADLQKFQSIQGELSSALARLMVVVEKYPELKANENFKELQAELAGTENRIAVERRKFNQDAKDYNVALKVFPNNIIANFWAFEERPYFEAEKGASQVPKVEFPGR